MSVFLASVCDTIATSHGCTSLVDAVMKCRSSVVIRPTQRKKKREKKSKEIRSAGGGGEMKNE
jgi:hypothetical protein